jgi:hypothetical protein
LLYHVRLGFIILFLIDIIKNCNEALDYFVESEQDLEFDEIETESFLEQKFEIDSDESEEGSAAESSQNESLPSSPVKKPRQQISFEDKKKAVYCWKSGKKTKLSLQSVSKRFRFVTSIRQLRKFEKQIEESGSRYDKLKEIWSYTFQEFKAAKENKLIVHDNDLQRWETKKKLELNLESFKASKKWLWKFKSYHRIVSRKITRFVSSRHTKEKSEILATANLFVNSTKLFLQNFADDDVYNSDQSGFSKEIHSDRTLEFQGERHVEATAQSTSATTHSYTIQPTISKSGRLLSPLFVILQEPTGKFGPQVEKELFRAPNIYVTASTSSKLTKELLQTWFKDVFFPNAGGKSVLLLDSLTTYKNRSVISSATPSNKQLEILTIPPQTTGLIHPLDKYGFRIWKNFIRRISDRVLLDGLDVNLYQRNNILKLQSLVHNQLTSTKFVNLFKYSWFASEYTDNHPGKFENPVEFCSNVQDKKCSRIDLSCNSVSFIICSWCEQSLCFEHFFIDFHFCNNSMQ